MGARRRRIGWVLFATLLFSYGYVHQRSGWNQTVRLDLLHALFKKGTVAIDDYHTNTGDKAKVGDHYYSEKAPGGTIVALPAFALAAMALGVVNVDIDSPLGWKVTEWVATAGSVGLITAVGGLAFFSFLARRTGERGAALATLGVFLGAMPFPYATALWGHGLVMAAFFIALWALDRTLGEEEPVLDALIGFCCGLAVAGEYPAALAAAPVFVVMLTMGPRRALRFIAGALPPLLVIPIYHWLVTGSPFALPYSGAVGFPGMRARFVGFGAPDPAVAFQLLLGEYRGLFFWSPILILCLPGFPTLWRRSRRLFWLAVTVPVAMVVAMSAYPYWNGGWTLGPRLLAPAVPFLAVAAGVGFARLPRVAVCAGATSVLLVSLATFADAMPPQGVLRPLRDFYWPRVLAGNVAMNLGPLAGLRGWWSVVPVVVVICAAVTAVLLCCRPPRPDATPHESDTPDDDAAGTSGVGGGDRVEPWPVP